MKKTSFQKQTLIFFICIFSISCKKSEFLTAANDPQEIKISSKIYKSNPLIVARSLSITGNLIASSFDPSNKVEIRIWANYVDGNNNHAEVSVDPSFVLVGGGARITNFNNTELGINALLTSAYPIDDNTFTTFAAESKDHYLVYNHRLWVYAIGMKLYDTLANPIDVNIIKNYLNITKNVSSMSSMPIATVAQPLGYNILSGGAKINWNAPGILLYENILNNGVWSGKGKSHKVIANGTIETYILSINNNISEFGRLSITSTYKVTANAGKPMASISVIPNTPDETGFLLCGIGGQTTYSGFGRLLYAMYPSNSTTATVGSKDHIQSDLTGYTYAVAVGVKKQ